MASIVERKGKYNVVYQYTNEEGKRKQKWETFRTKAEAVARKKEIEYKESAGIFVVPVCSTLNDLLREYVALYGKEKWALSTYSANTALIEHYITPLIENLKLSEINTRVIEKYYQRLLKTPSVEPTIGKKKNEFLTPSTVKNVHKLLRSCFEQAVKWELVEKNPCIYATLPKVTHAKREIWTADVLFHAIEICDDERLKLSMNLAFACSLRIGELLGLTWDCVDISQESMDAGTAYIYINKELQRVNRNVLNALDKKDVVTIFPPITSRTSTVQVLKAPKTQTSTRKIFLPRTVAEMLADWKRKQDAAREMLGCEYQDFNLVMAGPLGMPTEAATITSAFRKLIEVNDLPPVVFHSLRHSSITYKLKLNGGDIKAVQGDSGHAQAKMVTDQYSHIIDDDRRHNAELFEEAFYGKKGIEDDVTAKQESPVTKSPEGAVTDIGLDAETLAKLASSPEFASLLKILAKNI